MVQAYTNEQLFSIAKENYNTLLYHCKVLEVEGYWEEPEKLLKYTISEALDLYVQSFLLLYPVYNNRMTEEERKFLLCVTDRNMLSIGEEGPILEESIAQAEKMIASPPILMQLCSLKDTRSETNLAEMFTETLLNIFMAMAYLNQEKGTAAVSYIRAYFKEIQAFITEDLLYLKEIDEKYMFRKICSEHFERGHLFDEKASRAQMKKRKEKQQREAERIALEEAKELEEMENDDNLELQNEDNIEIELQEVVFEGSEEEVETQVVREQTIPSKKEVVLSEEEIAKAAQKAKMEMEEVKEAKRAAALEKLMNELNNLIGLENVKNEMQSLVNLIKVRKMREQHNMPQMEMSYHMVFTGNPGTGKTTVARIVAGIYKELGILSKGNFIETDRAGLVAGYIGQTAMKVTEVVEKAKGGVLFIDEAYSLSSHDGLGADFGTEAIDTLVKLMEDNRNDLVVIVAGYTEEMKDFLKSNTGLVSRFNKFVEFKDYSNEELLNILVQMGKKSAMEFTEDALEHVRKMLDEMTKEKRQVFGNARGIRNVFEKIVTNQANRIIVLPEPTIQELCQITYVDVLGTIT